LNPNHPAWPQPDQIKGLLEQNPLYNQVIPTADCALRQIDLPTASIDALEQYLNDVMACLMYVWYTPVYDAGYQMPRPSVTVYSSPTKTPCGQVEELVRAYYCPTNQQIYFGIELMTSYGRYSGERAVVLYILAHEYAHAVQYRTQILGSQLVLFPNADSEADAAESNRRLELQADCWSGAALNAMRESLGLTNTEQEHAVNSRANAGDPTPDPLGSHGSGPTGARWLRIGFGANSPGTCNTWIVPYDEVT
jgi:predicted metalloprotease